MQIRAERSLEPLQPYHLNPKPNCKPNSNRAPTQTQTQTETRTRTRRRTQTQPSSSHLAPNKVAMDELNELLEKLAGEAPIPDRTKKMIVEFVRERNSRRANSGQGSNAGVTAGVAHTGLATGAAHTMCHPTPATTTTGSALPQPAISALCICGVACEPGATSCEICGASFAAHMPSEGAQSSSSDSHGDGGGAGVATKNRTRGYSSRYIRERFVAEDGMVDAFAHFHPDAKNRFTCWNQRTNERFNVPDNPYSNNGR